MFYNQKDVFKFEKKVCIATRYRLSDKIIYQSVNKY